MNEHELMQMMEDVQDAIDDRRRLGEYNADAVHMMLLLGCMKKITAHAIIGISKEKKKAAKAKKAKKK